MIVFYNCKNTFGEKYTGNNEHFHFVRGKIVSPSPAAELL